MIALAVLALLSCAVLFAGQMALTHEIASTVGAGHASRIERLSGPRPAIVLSTEASCLTCRERLDDLGEYFRENGRLSADHSVIVLQPSGKPDVTASADFEIVVDAEAVLAIGSNVVPTLLEIDREGRVVESLVAGSREALVSWLDSRLRNTSNAVQTARLDRYFGGIMSTTSSDSPVIRVLYAR